MDPETADRLVELNHRFYQRFAASFSETRLRLQPGVTRLLEDIPSKASILDLGCGGGALAGVLAQRGQQAPYLGLDFSEGLLAAARATLVGVKSHPQVGESGESLYEFHQADLTNPAWVEILPAKPFDYILAFAVLHHIPGTPRRVRLLKKIRQKLASGGQFLLSNWQFLNSERLRDRIQPWEIAEISPNDVDPGDALLDWRRGGRGLRYAHQFSEAELLELAANTGFSVRTSFLSDGEGGNLGLYQVWDPG